MKVISCPECPHIFVHRLHQRCPRCKTLIVRPHEYFASEGAEPVYLLDPATGKTSRLTKRGN